MSVRVAGRTPSTLPAVSCPPWCIRDHSNDFAGDVWHSSAPAVLKLPTASTKGSSEPGPQMWAELMAPDAVTPGDQPCIYVDSGQPGDAYVELDVEQADRAIERLKAFTARMESLRDQLAALKGEAS